MEAVIKRYFLLSTFDASLLVMSYANVIIHQHAIEIFILIHLMEADSKMGKVANKVARVKKNAIFA